MDLMLCKNIRIKPIKIYFRIKVFCAVPDNLDTQEISFFSVEETKFEIFTNFCSSSGEVKTLHQRCCF